MPKGSDNPFPSALFVEGTTPSSPSSGDQRLFVRSSDHVLCLVNSSGTVTAVGSGGSGTFMGASAWRSTTQTISTATQSPISLDTEDYDTDAIHDNSSNPSRFTVPTGGAGKWVGLAYVNWDVNSTGIRYIWWLLNGTRIRSSLVVQPANITGQDMQNVLRAVTLADGDYLEAAVYQDSGGNRTIGSGSGDERAAVAVWRVG